MIKLEFPPEFTPCEAPAFEDFSQEEKSICVGSKIKKISEVSPEEAYRYLESMDSDVKANLYQLRLHSIKSIYVEEILSQRKRNNQIMQKIDWEIK